MLTVLNALPLHPQFHTKRVYRRPFSKMEDEMLIENVRKYEFIYNLKHPKYMDTVKKEIAWKKIAEQLKQPATACKQRWQCLRDAYRRALNKRKGKTGEALKNVKRWKYEKEMAFVAPFLVKRKAQESLEITSDDEDSNNGDKNDVIDLNVSENPDTEYEVDDTSAVDLNYFDTDNIRGNNPFNQQSITKTLKDLQQPASDVLLAKLLYQNRFEASRGHDELDRFFLNISDTVKKFSPYQQALAKNKIFTLVSEMELQQLAPNTSIYAYTRSPQSDMLKVSPSSTPMPTGSL